MLSEAVVGIWITRAEKQAWSKIIVIGTALALAEQAHIHSGGQGIPALVKKWKIIAMNHFWNAGMVSCSLTRTASDRRGSLASARLHLDGKRLEFIIFNNEGRSVCFEHCSRRNCSHPLILILAVVN